MNYFEFYGLPLKFNLNELDLKTKYFNLLKTTHPDFFINDPVKYAESQVASSFNNEAYKCLSNFISRAFYLLAISETQLDEKLPPDFLMEMMELNEGLAELKTAYKDESIEDFKNQILNINKALGLELKELTEKADGFESFDKMPLSSIKENLLKHKYILRLKETLANIAPL